MIIVSIIEWLFHAVLVVAGFLFQYVLPDLALTAFGGPAKKRVRRP